MRRMTMTLAIACASIAAAPFAAAQSTPAEARSTSSIAIGGASIGENGGVAISGALSTGDRLAGTFSISRFELRNGRITAIGHVTRSSPAFATLVRPGGATALGTAPTIVGADGATATGAIGSATAADRGTASFGVLGGVGTGSTTGTTGGLDASAEASDPAGSVDGVGTVGPEDAVGTSGASGVTMSGGSNGSRAMPGAAGGAGFGTSSDAGAAAGNAVGGSTAETSATAGDGPAFGAHDAANVAGRIDTTARGGTGAIATAGTAGDVGAIGLTNATGAYASLNATDVLDASGPADSTSLVAYEVEVPLTLVRTSCERLTLAFATVATTTGGLSARLDPHTVTIEPTAGNSLERDLLCAIATSGGQALAVVTSLNRLLLRD